MKTLEQATETQGVTLDGERLNLHFSPLPNWYGCSLGFDCPRCENPIDWEWEGKMPMVTNGTSVTHLKPKTKGAKLIAWGHRWILLECNKCHTQLNAENFD